MTPRRARPATEVQERLDAIVVAATVLFSAQGFRRTQMADVAHAAGVSPGNLYNYVESKEALFRLVLERALALSESPRAELPVPAETLERTVEWLRLRLDFREFPLLAAESTDIAGVIGEVYDVLDATADAINVIEASARDVPELASVLDDTRSELLRRLANLIDAGVQSGALRPVVDESATARLILESANWFARKRARGTDTDRLSDRVARDTVVHVLSHGLVSAGANRPEH